MRQQPQCCGNSKCQTTQTPLWRKGWFSHEGKTVMLCNACGLHYKKGHYCMYCHQIYRESDADDYANPWIGCDRCSRWVHQKCEEANGHHWKQHKAYLCPDCRCLAPSTDSTATTTTTTPTTPTTTTNPGSQMIKGKSNKTAVIKKRRRTPVGSRNESPASPSIALPHQRTVQLQNYSPSTPVSPISPGSNFVLFAQQHVDKQSEPTTPTPTIFDPNMNAMPCWNQLQSSIQNLPATIPAAPLSVVNTNSKKRKIDTSTTTTTKKKKSRTTTTITTTTTHRLNTAGIDALMGAVAEQRKEETIVPHLDLHITTTVRKGKQTSRKMNADARSAAIHASSTDTPTTPTFYAPPLFATTMTTTTTTVLPNPDDAAKSAASLTEEQFYQYQQLIMQQKAGPSLEDGELSNDSSASSVSTSSSNNKPPVTIMQNTFGSVDKLGNFYGSFNESEKQPQASPYGMLMDGDEDYEVVAAQRRPQKRTRASPPKKVTTTTTTLTMTTTVSAAVKSKRVRDRMAKKSVNYGGSSSGTEDSDYEPEIKSSKWERAAKALNVSLEDAHSVLVNRFPKAPVLKKMGSLWAICEVIRVQDQRSE